MLIKQLNVEMDDEGILRCYGRLKYAELPETVIKPILLPTNDYVTQLIVTEIHEKLCHGGINHTLNQLRNEFWIPSGRNEVRKRITRCRSCKRMKGPPFALPRMPPWPRERISRSNPFQFVGTDYFGPLNVEVSHEVEGEAVKSVKNHCVCLFTCLATRAVHLEAVPDCTPGSFNNALSRFIARRGAPEQFVSDNGPQFVLAKNLFDRTWQQTTTTDAVKSYISEKGIKWKLIVQLSPWQGGVFERLVGITKNMFKMVVGRRLLKHDDSSPSSRKWRP